MSAPSVRTVRSFCRVCTSVCGILVEVDGDMVTGMVRYSGVPVSLHAVR